MNWKFDFSPETSAALDVSELPRCTRSHRVALGQDQVCR